MPIVITGRHLIVDLVILKIFDCDIILRMDFLGIYIVNIYYSVHKVTFKPDRVEKFEYVNIYKKRQKMMISGMRL